MRPLARRDGRGDAGIAFFAGDGRVAALVGVSDLVVVSTPDVVFVGPLDSAGALKTVVQKLRATHPELVNGLASERKGATPNGGYKGRA